IQHPRDANAIAKVVEGSDLAVATSGAYERGEHVRDPHTGAPPGGILSVTVTGPDLGTADAYATAAFAMGARRAPGWTARLLGDAPFAIEDVMARLPPREFAARAALDAALYDLQGKLSGLPVWRLLGLRRAGPPTSWTIWLGDPDDMARRAEKVAGRFRRLKLKLGGGDGLDVERVRAVRSVTELPLQCDVNEAWTIDEALDALPQIDVEYGVQLPSDEPGLGVRHQISDPR